MISRAFEKALKKAKERNWDTLYVLVDLHDTCIEANYSNTHTPTKIFKESKIPLQMMSKNPHIKLIMWTCSHPEQIILYDKIFRDIDVHFDYFNENPEVITKGSLTYGNYDKKMYANIIIDDKAGFDPEFDWKLIENILTDEKFYFND